MDRPDDPPGPVNPGALALLLAFSGVLVGLYFAIGSMGFDLSNTQCQQTVQLAPQLLGGGVCGLASSVVVAAPLWLLWGSPRGEALVEDEDGIEWSRPRVHSRLLAPAVLGAPVLLGMLLGGFVPRSHGTACEILDFDHGDVFEESLVYAATSERTCLDSGLSLAERSACRSSWLGFAAQGGTAGAVLLFVGLAATRSRISVAEIAVDARGVTLDGRHIAYADLDDVYCSNTQLVFVPFDTPKIAITLRSDEVGFARYLCARIRQMLPDEVEERPTERARISALHPE